LENALAGRYWQPEIGGRRLMTEKRKNHLSDLQGLSSLAVDATRGVVEIVEAMQRAISGGPVLGLLTARPVQGITDVVYRSISSVTGLVGASLDAALGQLASLIAETRPWPEAEGVRAALNGVLGDHLAATRNPLAIEMRLRRNGEPLVLERAALAAALPHVTGRVLLLAHGSAMNDLQWMRKGHDHGAALERDHGYTAVYLHYNSGLHVSTNGRALAALLEALVAQWPVPLEELVIVAFSMGGLVTRSACHVAAASGQTWLGRLRKIVFVGTPHHGAPLERGGSWLQALLGVVPYSAPLARLGNIRSAGVTDLRHGNLLDDDWEGRDRFLLRGDTRRPLPLPTGVTCYAMAATRSKTAAAARLAGDGLVPVESALGLHHRPEMTLRIPKSRQWIGAGLSHLDMLSSPKVYAKLSRWLA
jgi:hypothetical protein